LKIFNMIDSMSCVTRWSQAHCTKNESVLEHTAVVAFYAFYLCSKHGINPGQSLLKALVHDVDEITTGDIPNPTKYNNPRITEEIRKIEITSACEISDQIFNGLMITPWKEAKNLDSESGCIIAISDLAAVSYKIWQEVNIGNNSFKKFIPNVNDAYGKLYINIQKKFITDIDDLLEFNGRIL